MRLVENIPRKSRSADKENTNRSSANMTIEKWIQQGVQTHISSDTDAVGEGGHSARGGGGGLGDGVRRESSRGGSGHVGDHFFTTNFI